MAVPHLTIEEMESELGSQLKKLRLFKSLDQKTLADRAGISVRALRNLESGEGSTVRTMLSVLRSLDRDGPYRSDQPTDAHTGSPNTRQRTDARQSVALAPDACKPTRASISSRTLARPVSL